MAENGLQIYEVTGKILELVKGLSPDDVSLVFKHVRELLGVPLEATPIYTPTQNRNEIKKEDGGAGEPGTAFFVKDKKPQITVHRVACLAYYLKRYRGIEEFKTQDITSLANEMRLPKFTNPSLFVNEAAKAGFLTRLGKGQKAITPGGEAFVEALPDYDAARNAMRENTLGRTIKPKPRKSNITKEAKSDTAS
jgi:hypothetical protein